MHVEPGALGIAHQVLRRHPAAEQGAGNHLARLVDGVGLKVIGEPSAPIQAVSIGVATGVLTLAMVPMQVETARGP